MKIVYIDAQNFSEIDSGNTKTDSIYLSAN